MIWNNDNKPKIGIVGAGFVGGAIARGFSLYADIKIYDNDKKRTVNSLEETCQSDFVFLCLPTPMERIDGGKADLSIIDSVCNQIKQIGSDSLFIIKSTVPIGTTKRIHEQTGLNIIHNPEFLTARNANIDFITPSRTILGGQEELTKKASELFKYRFPGNNILLMSSDESEAVKYIANGFFAMKVLYFNEVFLGLKEYGLDWNRVMNGVLTDGRIGVSHYQVPGHDGKFGVGGVCVLPDAEIKTRKNNKTEKIETIESFAKTYLTYSDDKLEYLIESTDAFIRETQWKKITNITERLVDEELFEFHTSVGVFTCTGDHLMPVKRDSKQILIPAKEIKNTDELFCR